MKEKYGYFVKPYQNTAIFVIANNIADAVDKLEEAGYKKYEFIHTQSFDILD